MFQWEADPLDIVGAYTIKELSRSHSEVLIEKLLTTEVSVTLYCACVCNIILIFYYRDATLLRGYCLSLFVHLFLVHIGKMV